MGSGNDSILDMYLYETNTLLEQLDGILLAAEQADTFSQDSVNEIFRIMHTIKGSSAMMEFNNIMTVAHRIEDLFFIIREKTIDVVPEQLRPELFDMIFQAVDFFRGEIEKVENGEPLSDSIDSIVDKINSLIDKIQGNGGPEAAGPAKPAAAAERAESAAPALPPALSRRTPPIPSAFMCSLTRAAAWRTCGPLCCSTACGIMPAILSAFRRTWRPTPPRPSTLPSRASWSGSRPGRSGTTPFPA